MNRGVFDRVDVETKLLERLILLLQPDRVIPWAAGSVAPAPRQQQLVCWPVASSSEERYEISCIWWQHVGI